VVVVVVILILSKHLQPHAAVGIIIRRLHITLQVGVDRAGIVNKDAAGLHSPCSLIASAVGQKELEGRILIGVFHFVHLVSCRMQAMEST